MATVTMKQLLESGIHFGHQQAGYGAFSVSRSNVDGVTRYIADQEEHHKRLSFQDEFIEFLKRHEIEFDPRYIWE